MVTVLARVNAETVHWVGTSMGGLIGMVVASLSPQPLVSRLVMNDVGPVLPPQAISRIGAYLGVPLRWDSVEQAADYLWTISKSFGPHTREQWLALTRPMLRPADDGGWRLHYDPAIAIPFQTSTPESAATFEASLWSAYDAVSCPTLLLRGADSDLLTAAHAQEMTRRGPCARLHKFAGVGHAPTLIASDQVQQVREFLLTA
jgi:pimeloyl-ACP methyl ester carboxylesterase